MAKRKVNFTVVKVNNRCEKMIKVMEESYKSQGIKLNVTDLAKACETMSKIEITKEFVAAASIIMKPAVKVKADIRSPLWD